MRTYRWVALVALALALGGCDGRTGASPAPPAAQSQLPDTPAVSPSTSISAPPSAVAASPGTTAKKTTTPKPPARFGPENTRTDMGIDTEGLLLAKPVHGVRHGVLKVRVTNRGPSPVWHAVFSVEVPASMTSEGSGWSGCDKLHVNEAGFPAGATCDKGYLGVGQTKTFALGMRSPAAEDGNDSLISRNILDVWARTPDGKVYSETNGDDNRRIFMVTRA